MQQAGFSLLEVLISVWVISFMLVVMAKNELLINKNNQQLYMNMQFLQQQANQQELQLALRGRG